MPLALTEVVVVVVEVAFDLLMSPLAVVSATLQVKPEDPPELLLVFVLLELVVVVVFEVELVVEPDVFDELPLEVKLVVDVLFVELPEEVVELTFYVVDDEVFVELPVDDEFEVLLLVLFKGIPLTTDVVVNVPLLDTAVVAEVAVAFGLCVLLLSP